MRTWREQLVAIKNHIEAVCKKALSVNSVILSWLVMHAAQTLTCYKVLGS